MLVKNTSSNTARKSHRDTLLKIIAVQRVALFFPKFIIIHNFKIIEVFDRSVASYSRARASAMLLLLTVADCKLRSWTCPQTA